MEKIQFLILFITLWSQQSLCISDDIWMIVKSAHILVNKFNTAMLDIESAKHFYAIIRGEDEGNAEIIAQLQGLFNRVHDLTMHTKEKFNRIEEEIKKLPNGGEIRIQINKISSFMRKNDDHWDELRRHRQADVIDESINSLTLNISTFSESELSEFRNTIVPRKLSVLGNRGLFELITNLSRRKRKTACGEGHTFHDDLVTLFRAVMITEVKAHLLLGFSHRWQFRGYNAWIVPVAMLQENFKAQFVEYIEGLLQQLRQYSLPYIRACDPADGSWRRGETFIELERFIQQRMFGTSRCSTSARCPRNVQVGSECGMLKFGDNFQCDLVRGPCEFVRSLFHPTRVCLATDGIHRIQWIDSSINGTQGRNSETCDGPLLDFGRFTDYCSCSCEFQAWRIYIGRMESNWAHNYVIVGMRFNRMGYILYIQIAEGKLESNGHISNFSWVEPKGDRFKGVAFSTLLQQDVWFAMNDEQVDPGHALIGIEMFSRIGSNQFGIILHGREFNYTTGELSDIKESVHGLSSALPKDEQDAYQFNELLFRLRASIYMKSYVEHTPDSDGFNLVRIEQSELDDDYGQSTLPFFEQTEVLTNPLSPLGGAGIYHKGSPGYAGFIALRVYPINYSYFIDDFMKKHDVHSRWEWNDLRH